ncbi:MAG TPA: acylphosphatase [Candidatus Limnocylindrales bacterium]|nr:acylphosphatase [Candidatus Limnocylindrales bacterium]
MPHEHSVAKRYYVSGIVQGVGYRYFALRTAQRLGVSGFVRNLRDGRVEVYAIAPVAVLVSFHRDLRRGPQGASVDEVAEEDAPLEPEMARSFSIQHEGW